MLVICFWFAGRYRQQLTISSFPVTISSRQSTKALLQAENNATDYPIVMFNTYELEYSLFMFQQYEVYEILFD